MGLHSYSVWVDRFAFSRYLDTNPTFYAGILLEMSIALGAFISYFGIMYLAWKKFRESKKKRYLLGIPYVTLITYAVSSLIELAV